MANTLTQIGIETGNIVEAYHVSQSIDAFTGVEAYDITLSGSFTVTGPVTINGLTTASQSNVLTIDSITGQLYYTASSAISGGGSTFTYEIGQYVPSQGGVIFHRWLSTTPGGTPTAGTTQNYLVLDVGYVGNNSTIWGLIGTNVVNSESNWDGLTNTNSIIGTPGVTPTDAAKLCADSTTGGFTDWYLPAVYELLTLRNNFMNVERGLIASGILGASLLPLTHHSSTEIDATNVLTVDLLTGNLTVVGKGNNFYTKAIRKFSI